MNVSRGMRRRTACQHSRGDPIHVFDEAQALQCPNDVAGDVNLPPVQAMKGGAREGMVIVMPALTKGQQSHHPFVAAAIGGLKCTLAKGVTDRVDAPGHMMGQEDAYESPPQEACPPTKQ